MEDFTHKYNCGCKGKKNTLLGVLYPDFFRGLSLRLSCIRSICSQVKSEKWLFLGMYCTLNSRLMTDSSRSMFWRFPSASSLAHASAKLYTYAATLPLLLYERPVFSASGAGAVLRLNQTSLHICRKTKGKIIRVGVLYTPFPIA